MIEIIQELNRVADALNKKYFEGKLPKMVITVQAYNKIASDGWFWSNKWADDKGNIFHEINLNPEVLNRSTLSVMTTLQHELIHAYCFENGIKDTSRNNRYHNLNFKQEAERRDLIVEKNDPMGWILTDYSPDFESHIKKLKVKEVFNLSRNTEESLPPTISKN